MQYLENYLKVLPGYDREEVESMIQRNTDLLEVKMVEKDEFEALIRRLSSRYEKATELKPTGEKLDAEHFNDMYGPVALDLGYLYGGHLHLEKVMANYDRILRGTLSDVERELNSLKTRVEELNLKAKGEDGLIIKTYGFEATEKSLHMETDREQFGHLFVDRDGRELPMAELNRSFHSHYLSLPISTKENAMQDDNGTATAKMKMMYETPGVKRYISYLPKKAVDSSPDTYWKQTVKTGSPAYTEIPKKWGGSKI